MRKILLCLVALVLTGCITTPEAPTRTYAPPGNPGGRLCAHQCKVALEHCHSVCRYDERLCTHRLQSQAIDDYEHYVRERFREKKPVELHPRDFEDISKCIPVTCMNGCQAGYDDCFQKCGGVISPSPQKTP